MNSFPDQHVDNINLIYAPIQKYLALKLHIISPLTHKIKVNVKVPLVQWAWQVKGGGHHLSLRCLNLPQL